MEKAIQVTIESKVNEIFTSTKVTQTFINSDSDSIQELEFISYKQVNNIYFSSFSVKICDLNDINNVIEFNSKIIEEEIAKKNDNSSSKDLVIYTKNETNDLNKIIIHIGNIPPEKKFIFITEFIQFNESIDNLYEIEFYKNIPLIKVFLGDEIPIDTIKGFIEIKINDKIQNIEKKINLNNIIINEEKFDKDTNNLIIKYEYAKNSVNRIKENNNKLCFKLESNNNIKLYSQLSSLNENEKYYLFNYKFKTKLNEENTKFNPAFFLFLVDMNEDLNSEQKNYIIESLTLSIQSLPVGSYYQILSLYSYYNLNDYSPLEYNNENLKKTIPINNILKPFKELKNLYLILSHINDSKNIYRNISLPKNIFILLSEKYENIEESLDMISKLKNDFSIYSFGLGNYYDENLVKNIGIKAKGEYNFCKDMKDLKEILIFKISNICRNLFIKDIKINSSFDGFNIYNVLDIKEKSVKNNLYRFYELFYITEENKEKEKDFNFTIKYKQKGKDCVEKYEKIKPIELYPGEELSKLILIKNIIYNRNISSKEKLRYALKYQIITKDTYLYFEDKKSKMIQGQFYSNNNKEKIIKKKSNPSEFPPLEKDDPDLLCDEIDMMEQSNNKIEFKDIYIKIKKEKEEIVKKIIACQNFIEGYWDTNDTTGIIKNKYEKEFKLLKNFNGKNIDDIVVMTAIIIYFINKEYPQLNPELIMIINKAKIYIKNKIGISYENLIENIGK